MIVESVWRVIRQSKGFQAFYDRIVGGQTGRKKVAVVATARKLLTVMRAMMLSGELFNEQMLSGADKPEPQAAEA